MAALPPQRNRQAWTALAVSFLASYVCPVLCLKNFNATIPRCAHKSHYLPELWGTDLRVKVYYSLENSAQRAMSDVLATMIYNALGIPVEAVFDEVLEHCRGDDACMLQTYGDYRDVDVMSLFFVRQNVAGDRKFVVSKDLNEEEVPECFRSLSDLSIDASEFEMSQANKSFCPDANLNRGENYYPQQFGLFVTRAAGQLLDRPRSAVRSPIWYRELYSVKWLSNWPTANRTLVEAAYVNKTTFFPKLTQGRRDAFYYVPPHCESDVESCYLIHKSLGTGETPGITEGLVATYVLPFIVYWMRVDDYDEMIEQYMDGTLGPMLIHGFIPNDYLGGEKVMRAGQRIQFPSCRESYAFGPDGTLSNRECDWPLLNSNKVVSSKVLQKFPAILPLIDALNINVRDVDKVLYASLPNNTAGYANRSEAVCEVAERTIEDSRSELLKFLRSCDHGLQAVDWDKKRCIVSCDTGEVAVYNPTTSQMECQCQPGWHLKYQYPSVWTEFQQLRGNYSDPDNMLGIRPVNIEILLNNYAANMLGVPNIEICPYECDEAGHCEPRCVWLDDVFGVPATQQCAVCPPDWVCLGGSQPPVKCPVIGATSAVGSSSFDDCVCEAGRFAPLTEDGVPDSGRCTKCPRGRFKEFPGDTECHGQCPVRTTSKRGIAFPFLCTCTRGYYLARLDPENHCVGCPDGATCPTAPDWKLFIPSIVKQDWRELRRLHGVPYSMEGFRIGAGSDLPTNVKDYFLPKFDKCPVVAACKSNDECGKGATGYLCSECPIGWGRGRIKPFPCDKCAEDGNKTLIGWGLLQVFYTWLLVGLIMLSEVAHGDHNVLTIPVLKAFWDHIDIVNVGLLASFINHAIKFQGWPEPKFSGFNDETCVWIIKNFLWKFMVAPVAMREIIFGGMAGQTFGCVLGSHPEWLLGKAEWTHNARVEYTRLIAMNFAIPIQYLLCLILWYPVYRILVHKRRVRLNKASTFLYNVRLLDRLAEGHENYLGMGRVIRDLKNYATDIKRDCAVLIWQAVQDDAFEDEQGVKGAGVFRIIHSMSKAFKHLCFYVAAFLEDSTPLLMSCAFFAYPMLFKFNAAAILCDSWPDDTRERRSKKFVRRVGNAGSIKCSTEDHAHFMVPALIGLGVWGVGYPLFLLFKLHRAKDFSKTKLRRWAFDLNGLDTNKSFSRCWPAFSAIRKALLWFETLAADQNMIVSLSLAWCACFIYIQSLFKPYLMSKQNALNRLQLSSLFAVQSFAFHYALVNLDGITPIMGLFAVLGIFWFHSFFVRLALGLLYDDALLVYKSIKLQINDTVKRADDALIEQFQSAKIEDLPQTGDIVSAVEMANAEDEEDSVVSYGLDSNSSSESELGLDVQFLQWARYTWQHICDKYPFLAMLLRLAFAILRCFFYLILNPLYKVFMFTCVKRQSPTVIVMDFSSHRLRCCGTQEDADFAIQEEQKRKPHGTDAESLAVEMVRERYESEHRSRQRHNAPTSHRPIGLGATRKDNADRAIDSFMALMEGQLQSYIAGYSVANLPMAYFGKIMEEACVEKMQKPRIDLIADILKDWYKETRGAKVNFLGRGPGMASDVFMSKLKDMADIYGRSSQRHWLLSLTGTELQIRMAASQSVGKHLFLPKFLRDCMAKSPISSEDNACQCDLEGKGRLRLRDYQQLPAQPFKLTMLGEDWREYTPPPTPRSIDKKLGRFDNDIIHWDVLEGVSRAERAELDADMHFQRKMFHKMCANWLEKIGTIYKEFARFEKTLRENMGKEISSQECIGHCPAHGSGPPKYGDGMDSDGEEAPVHVQSWWVLPHTSEEQDMSQASGHPIDIFRRIKNMLFYDLDPDCALEILKALEQRVRPDSWETSHLRWLCSAMICPERLHFAGLGATPAINHYRHDSELDVLREYQKVRYRNVYHLALNISEAVQHADHDKLGLEITMAVLERFLHNQSFLRYDEEVCKMHGTSMKLDSDPQGGFDERFMRQHIKSMPLEEQYKVAHTINCWRKAFSIAECDKTFGKALQHELLDLSTRTKGGHFYKRLNIVHSPEVEAATGLPRGADIPEHDLTDPQETVWDALAGSHFYHVGEVVARRIEDRQWLVQQEIKAARDSLTEPNPQKVLELTSALSTWTANVEIWFARAVFQADEKKAPEALATALIFLQNRTERYYAQGVMDWDTRVHMLRHLNKFPNRHWVADLYLELEAQPEWSRFTLEKPQYTFKANDKTKWMRTRLAELRKLEPLRKRTDRHGVPFWPQNAAPDEDQSMARKNSTDQGVQVYTSEFESSRVANAETYCRLELILHGMQWKKEKEKIQELDQAMRGDKEIIRHAEQDMEEVENTNKEWRALLKVFGDWDVNESLPPKAAIDIQSSPEEGFGDNDLRGKLCEWIQEQMIFGYDHSPPPASKQVNLEAGLEWIEPGLG